MTEESLVEVELTEEDIPGAMLDERLEKHAIPELKWWLLCHGRSGCRWILPLSKAPATSLKGQVHSTTIPT